MYVDKVFKNTSNSIAVDCEQAYKAALQSGEYSHSWCAIFRKSCGIRVSLGSFLAKFAMTLVKGLRYIVVRLRCIGWS